MDGSLGEVDWAQASTLFTALAFLAGLVVGSFLNVVIHRVPAGLSVVRPRSRCPRCETPISARDNVPVLSWLLLRGACRHCAAPISWRYPAVELLTGVVFAGIVAVHGPTPIAPVLCGFAAVLIACAGIDFDEHWIPDGLSLGGLAFGLTLVPLVHGTVHGDYGAAFATSAIGAALGGGLLWTVGFVHARISVLLGREFDHWPGEGEALPRPLSLDYWTWFPGLGFGDVKLMAMVGAFLGPLGVAHVIVLAAAIGLVGGLLLLTRREAKVPFGFAPAIAAATLVATLLPGTLLA